MARHRDPTRTTTLQRRFARELRRRFRRIKILVRELFITLDVLGLHGGQPFTFNVDPQAWRFQTDPQKLASFRVWLQQQVDQEILTVVGPSASPWTATFVESAYLKGVTRSFVDARAAQAGAPEEFLRGSSAEFLRSAFPDRVRVSKIQFLSTRTFEELNGITAVMSQRLNRIFAESLVTGAGSAEIARRITQSVDGITRTRAEVLARTEIIAAHSEGQLDSFEALGIDELGVMAEWLTAGDDRVCPQCNALEGMLFTVDEARGLIPRHPNCRCAWIPSEQGSLGTSLRDTQGASQKRQEERDAVLRLPDGVHDPEEDPEGRNPAAWVAANLPEMKQTFDGLSFLDRDALRAYKDFFFDVDVKFLRKKKVVGIPLPKGFARRIASVDSLFTNAQLDHDVVVFRAAFSPEIAKLKPGDMLLDRGFVSTALSKEIALDLVETGSDVLLEITLRKGQNAVYLDFFPDVIQQTEVLLPRNSKFLVVATDIEDGVKKLALERIE